MASFYERHILPHVVGRAPKIVPKASGEVLAIGIGGGLNLAFYDLARVASVEGFIRSRGSCLLSAVVAEPLPYGLEEELTNLIERSHPIRIKLLRCWRLSRADMGKWPPRVTLWTRADIVSGARL